MTLLRGEATETMDFTDKLSAGNDNLLKCYFALTQVDATDVTTVLSSFGEFSLGVFIIKILDGCSLNAQYSLWSH